LTQAYLQRDLDTALGTGSATAGQGGEEVGDVVPRMPVQASPQPLLVEEVGNQTNASAEHEQTVEDTHLEIVLGLLAGEGSAVAEKIHEADSDAAVDVEDEVVFFGRCYCLDSQRIVEQFGAGKILFDILLDELDAEIGVVS
jgi:hypothetical protein